MQPKKKDHHRDPLALPRRLVVAAVLAAFWASAQAQLTFDEVGEELALPASIEDNRSIRLADVNGDGHNDLLVGAWGSEFAVWINDGAGNFSDGGFSPAASDANRVNILIPMDFDDDGDIDIFAVRGGNEDSTLWTNDGSGGFTLSSQTFPTGSAAAAGDLDGDGDIDLVFGSGEILLNDGSGSFSNLASLSTNAFASLGDLDGDGNVDILMTTGSSGGTIYFNDGASPPAFSSTSSVPVTGLRSTELIDVDGDGSMDAVTNRGVWLNDGSASFTLGQNWSTGDDIMEAAVADIDGDGDPDVALAQRETANVGTANEVWLNDGSGGFTDSALALGDGSSGAVAFGDVNGDGDVDLAFGNAGTALVVLYRNLATLGPGERQPTASPIPTLSTWSVILMAVLLAAFAGRRGLAFRAN